MTGRAGRRSDLLRNNFSTTNRPAGRYFASPTGGSGGEAVGGGLFARGWEMGRRRWVSELYVVRGAWYVVRGWNQTRRARWHVVSSTSYKLRATSHEPQLQAISYKPLAAFSTPRTRPSCLPRSGVHAARTTKTLSPSSNSSRVAHYGPSHHHHVPRTTYPRADTWFRPYDEITRITSHEPRLQATSLRPLAAFFVIPAKRAFRFARAGIQTGAASVARGCNKKQW